MFTLFTINKNTAPCVLATQVLSGGATVMHLRPTRAMHSTGTAKHKDLANAALAAKRTARSTEQAIMTERKLFRRLAPNFHFKIFNSSQDHYNLLVSINMDSVCAVGYNFSLQIGVASAQALGRSRRVEMLSTPSLPCRAAHMRLGLWAAL